MKRQKLAIVAVILLGAALYIGANLQIQSNQRHATVSAYNRKAGGVSIFAELKSQMDAGSVVFRKEPLLYDDDLEETEALVILSPATEITAHESEIIASYVKEGGTLILGFHDQATLGRARRLISALGGPVTPFMEPRFKNGQSVLVSPKQDVFVFKAGETYELYSPVQLEHTECRGGGFECYVYEASQGEGKVVILAGLPFFGNVLIGRQANRAAAIRLAQGFERFEIDEFHHLFSDKTLVDLLKRPAFALPIGGSILAALLLFAFGYSPFHERSLRIAKEERPPRTLHGMSESVVFRVFEKPTAYPAILAQHRQFLARLYPSRRAEIEARGPEPLGDKSFLEEARRLLRLHKRWSEIRGGK